QRARRNVEHLELQRDIQAQGVGQVAAHLVELDVEQYLRPLLIQPLEQAGGRLQYLQRSAHGNGGSGRLLRDKAYLKQHAQQVYHVIELLRRRGIGDVNGAQRHAVELAMVLRRVGCDDDLFIRKRRPESVGNGARRLHRGSKIHVINVEIDAPRGYRVV